MKNALIENIGRVHTTEMGVERIKKNLGLGTIDVVEWCRERILDKNARIERLTIKSQQGNQFFE